MSKAEVTIKVKPTEFERIIEALVMRERAMIDRSRDNVLDRSTRDAARAEVARTKALRDELMSG